MSEMGELWRDYREEKRRQREERRPKHTADIYALMDKGLKVELITVYHFRVEGTIDLFPTNRRYHNLKTGTRGRYSVAERIVERELRYAKCATDKVPS